MKASNICYATIVARVRWHATLAAAIILRLLRTIRYCDRTTLWWYLCALHASIWTTFCSALSAIFDTRSYEYFAIWCALMNESDKLALGYTRWQVIFSILHRLTWRLIKIVSCNVTALPKRNINTAAYTHVCVCVWVKCTATRATIITKSTTHKLPSSVICNDTKILPHLYGYSFGCQLDEVVTFLLGINCHLQRCTQGVSIYVLEMCCL